MNSSQQINSSLWYLTKQWLRQCYDEIGMILLTSFFFLVCFLGSALPMHQLTLSHIETGNPHAAVIMTGWLIVILVVACGWLALNRYFEQVLTHQYPSWMSFWQAFPKYWSRSILFVISIGVPICILVLNLYLYPRILGGYLLPGAYAITVWMLLFLGMIQAHLIPFLVHQDRPFLVAFKRAAILAAWKPMRSVFILLLQMTFIGLSLITPPLMLLLPGMAAMLGILSLLILLEEWKDPYEKTPEAIRAGQ